MAKIRGIKPDFWTDEDIMDLSIPARLLFIGLWNYACDNGHLQDKPKQIKMRIMPADDQNVAELLRELAAAGRIHRIEGWIVIPNFTKHQKPDRRYFTTCDREGCDEPVETVSQRESRRAPGVRTTSARRAPTVRTTSALGDGDGDGDGEVSSAPAGKPRRATSLPDDFTPNDTNRRIAAERGVDLRACFEQFADHHRARGSTMKDWHAAFNTWLRRERPAVGAAPSNVRHLPTGEVDPATLPPPEDAGSWMRRRPSPRGDEGA